MYMREGERERERERVGDIEKEGREKQYVHVYCIVTSIAV